MRLKGIRLFLTATRLLLLISICPVPFTFCRLVPENFPGMPKAAFSAQFGYIPINEIARVSSSTKLWFPETRRMTLKSFGKTVRIAVGSALVLINGGSYVMSGPAVLDKGEVLVPRDFVQNVLNKIAPRKYKWDEKRRELLPVEVLTTLEAMDLYEDSSGTVLRVRADSTISGEVVFPSKRQFNLRIPNCEPAKGYVFPEEGVGLVEKITAAKKENSMMLSIRLTGEAESYSISYLPDGFELKFAENPNAGSPFIEKLISGEAKRLRKIVIDPGHGGTDSGVVGDGGTKEKDITLDIALSLKEFLERNSSLSVLLTRTEDLTVRQDERIEFLKDARADMVLSLHIDGYPSDEARGVSIMIPNEEKDQSLRVLAAMMLDSFSSLVGVEKTGIFVVPVRLLKGSGSRGLVVDCGFLSNPVDEDFLKDSTFRKELGVAMGKGLLEFVNLQRGD